MSILTRAAILDAPKGCFTIEQAELPEPRQGEIIVKQVLCGVCGTDVHIYNGHWAFDRFPLTLGHEIFGRVHTLGGGDRTDARGETLKEGDLVYVAPALPCWQCYACRVLREPGLCMNGRAYGFSPFPERPPHFQGGFSEYLYLDHPSTTLFKMRTSPEVAVLLEPFSVGIHFVERAQVELGDTVVIQGAGAIGIFALAAARAAGAQKAIVIGAPASRLKVAEAFGADVTINIEEITDPKERIARVHEQTRGGLGADVVFECAGVPAALAEGLEMVRRGGTYVEGGHFTDAGDVTLNPYRHMVRKHVRLVGVWGSSVRHFVKGHAVLESGRFPFDQMVTHILPLSRIDDAIRALSSNYRLDGKEVVKIAIAAN